MEETGMGEKAEIHYQFDTTALRDLRAAVNEKQNLSFEKTGEKKQKWQEGLFLSGMG